MHVERLQRVSIVSGEEISRDKHREKKKMYPGPPSTLLSNQQKKPVNRYDYQPLKQQDRIGTASYHQPQLYGGMKPFGKRMSSQLQVELTLRDPYLKNSNAKPRLKWSLELQDRFVQSVDALGGEKYATPKKILLLMNASGLTLNHLKSHLQKYRIALKAEQKPVALPPPPRRPRANPKKTTSARSAASGRRGSSSSTKKTGANKWKAESSKARKQNGNKQVKIQDVEMAMEGTSKSTGSNEATIASAFTSSTSVANHAIGAYAFPSARGKEPANQTMGNHIIGASAFASAKGKEPAIQTMGNNIIGASAFSSSKGKEPATDFETDPYPFRPTIFDIQFESYYPIHYSREEVIVRNGNVAGASVKEQIAFYQPLGQASISRNLAYLNHSSPDSNSSFQQTGHGTILANYQMDTRSSFSSMFENSMETGSSFSSTFVEVDTGSNLSPMSENSMETGSTVSSMFGNFSSSLSSTFSNSVDTGSSFSSRFWNSADPGPSSSSMFANPMERGSSFSVTANPITEPGLGFSPVTENPNPMELGLSFPSMTANLMNPGLSFPSMGTGSSQTTMFGDPLDIVGSSLCSTFGNSMETGLNFSSVFGDSIDPGTSISNLDENGLITGDFGLDSGDFFHGITGMFQ